VLKAFAAVGVELDLTAPRDEDAILNLIYVVRLVRAHPHDLTHGEDHKALRGAVRELLDTLPRMIAATEAAACATKDPAWATAGVATAVDWAAAWATAGAVRVTREAQLDRFTFHLRALLAAAQPFAPVARATRTSRGWWHDCIGMLAPQIALVLRQRGLPAGASVPTARRVCVVVALLALAGIECTPEAVVKALRRP